MGSDLVKIKDKYGERMMHLCRELFPTILEESGKLFDLLSTHFAYSKYLYDDIDKNLLVDNFKNYIYGLLVDDEEVELFEDSRNPYELLDEAGYTLYMCRSEDDIQSFRRYYDGEEILCSFRGYRLRTCYVFFAVKKNADEIKREDFIHPYRQDLYGTSVISIQFTKGDVNTLSIKNRYNHHVTNPDATFSNNLENIIPGLTRSFERYFNLNISQNKSCDFEIPGYVRTRDGKYYKYNYEINNVYYCDNNVIIDNFEVVDKYQEKEKYIVMDYFIIDLVNKKISLYDESIGDSFISTLGNIKKIDIVKGKDTKRLKITFEDDTYMFIEIDKYNRMVSYSNEFISDIPDDFLKENKYLEKMDISNALKIGDNVLYENRYMKEINASKVIEIGDKFLYKNDSIKKISFSKVIRIGNDFLYNNQVIDRLDMDNLEQVGNNFLYKNTGLKEIIFSNLMYVGDNFLSCNRIIENVYLEMLVNVGNNFLGGNKLIQRLYLPCLRQVGDNFLRCNEIIWEIVAGNLEIVGNNFMYSNRNLIKAILSRLRIVENNFLYKNNSIEILDLSELVKAGQCFMKENNSLLVLLASKLRKVGIKFLCSNDVLEYIDLSMLEDYGRYFFDSSPTIKKRILVPAT